MKVLVTGGTGFIGRALVPTLRSAGHSVRIALRSPRSDCGPDCVVVGDIGPHTNWQVALEGTDAVVHAAARVHVMHDYRGSAAEFHRTNAEGTIRLARDAAAAGAKRFVFISTIKVNGDATTERAFDADDAPDPRDAYSRSKYEAECGIRSLAGLDPVIIRPPLVHGPGARGNLARFCRIARLGLPLPLAAILNRRDILGVRNLASLIDRCLSHPDAPHRVFLAADGEPLSTPQLYRLIAESLGCRARLVHVPVGLLGACARSTGLSREFDRLTQSLEVDIGKTRELLGWTPPISAALGLAEMATAFLEARE